MSDINVLDDEDIEDLGIEGFRLLQKKTGFRFGVDAVLLSKFVSKRGGAMLDLCSGSGIIPILMLALKKADKIEALEIVDSLAEMIHRSIELNNVADRARVSCGNLCYIEDFYKKGSMDYVTCNPPYMKLNAGMGAEDANRNIARFEVECTIDDVARAASYVLKSKGSLFLIHRAYRLVDIFNALVKYHLEPKRLRLVSSDYKKPPTMVLIEAVKDGNRQLNIEPNLLIGEVKC